MRPAVPGGKLSSSWTSVEASTFMRSSKSLAKLFRQFCHEESRVVRRQFLEYLSNLFERQRIEELYALFDSELTQTLCRELAIILGESRKYCIAIEITQTVKHLGHVSRMPLMQHIHNARRRTTSDQASHRVKH